MMLKSENYHITLWNWDMLCMGDVFTNDISNGLPEMINWEEFLMTVANFALNLAEEKYWKPKRIRWLKEVAKDVKKKKRDELKRRENTTTK